MGEAVRRNAVVFARGVGGSGRAGNTDPLKAAKSAMAQCKRVTRECRLVNAVWDSGATRGARALGKTFSFLAVNKSTREEAESVAIKGCEAGSLEKGNCKIEPSFVTDRHAYYTIAASKSYSGFGASEDLEQAKTVALESCKKGSSEGDSCAVTEITPNTGPTPEPANLKKVYAEIERNVTREAAKEKTVQMVRSRTNASNVLRCSNQCRNGSCVRTFSNGRKENWQAPRVMDGLGNWNWDTMTV